MRCNNVTSAGNKRFTHHNLMTQFVYEFNRDRRQYPAISLAVLGDLTAIGNDYDFNDIFARHLEAFGAPGDVLATFTTSGNSENVRRALCAAKKKQLRTIAFLGKDSGTCEGLADINFWWKVRGRHASRKCTSSCCAPFVS